MIAIIDYDAGNISSVKNALDFLSAESVLTDDPEVIDKSDGIIVPGVGAFPDAMENMKQRGLIEVLRQQSKKKPLLGICLGMQILFETGFEFKRTSGLSLLPGEVIKINAEELKIPHMGWNSLTLNQPSPLLKGVSDGDFVYFVHSFRAETEDKNILAYTTYGEKIPALVGSGNVYGAQFHPEKSSQVGLAILKNFKELVG